MPGSLTDLAEPNKSVAAQISYQIKNVLIKEHLCDKSTVLYHLTFVVCVVILSHLYSLAYSECCSDIVTDKKVLIKEHNRDCSSLVPNFTLTVTVYS